MTLLEVNNLQVGYGNPSSEDLTMAVDDEPGAAEYLRFLGRSHRRFELEPAHFDLWTRSLVPRELVAFTLAAPVLGVAADLWRLWAGRLARSRAVEAG